MNYCVYHCKLFIIISVCVYCYGYYSCTKISFIIGLAYAVLHNTIDNNGLIMIGACILCPFKIYDIIFNCKDTDLFKTFQKIIWKYITDLTANEKKQN